MHATFCSTKVLVHFAYSMYLVRFSQYVIFARCDLVLVMNMDSVLCEVETSVMHYIDATHCSLNIPQYCPYHLNAMPRLSSYIAVVHAQAW